MDARWDGHIEEYLRILDNADRQENFEDNPEQLTREFIEEKLQEAWEHLKSMRNIRGSWKKAGKSRCP